MSSNYASWALEGMSLNNLSSEFDTGTAAIQTSLEQAMAALTVNPSDPQTLADYQSRLSEYNLYRNAQSNTIKVFKDIDAAIIQNFR